MDGYSENHSMDLAKSKNLQMPSSSRKIVCRVQQQQQCTFFLPPYAIRMVMLRCVVRVRVFRQDSPKTGGKTHAHDTQHAAERAKHVPRWYRVFRLDGAFLILNIRTDDFDIFLIRDKSNSASMQNPN